MTSIATTPDSQYTKPSLCSFVSRVFVKSSPFERAIFFLLCTLTLLSGTILLFRMHATTLVTVPQRGGTFIEGIVGAPRSITPVAATSQSDHDVVSVVYAGLLTRNASGDLVPELAETYTVSDDARTYTFTLRKGLQFHDGEPLTARDIAFTIRQIQNPAVRSPLAQRWANIQVTTPDEYTVIFTLPAPFSSFIHECTVGILPEHLWGGLSSDEYAHTDLNIRPIGSGPYKTDTVTFDESGIPTQYTLSSFENYALGEPNIQRLSFRIYRTQDALHDAFVRGSIDGLSGIHGKDVSAITNMRTTEGYETAIYHTPMLRLFAVFFNQNNQRLFTYPEVRTTATASVQKARIVSEVFDGYASIISEPSVHTLRTANIKEHTTSVITDALAAEGWKKNATTGVYEYEGTDSTVSLSFTLNTVDTPDLAHTAEILQQMWKQQGIDVSVRVHDPADFTQLVVRPRMYEALLFGFDVGHTDDLYTFWHSSARTDPGLNVAQYTDIESDRLLEKIRATTDTEERTTLIEEFTGLLAEDESVLFLYAPHSIYLLARDVQHVSLHPLTHTSERFDTIHTWYRESADVWSFLAQ
jgi:peptide/nickel transport system substrate-binding protein